ncbi:hypothetical protein ES332_D05G143800v1 [Gossypium tomentosum]|uniref:Uncharacterized protein n=1 Tax=Gossypium tomentosum TaxID=34277 RepID=A0A5D2KUI1_GOSTO|nr:hypothetical protein ES332_D05G143800v1 [Gossypium tomentosum]
MFSSPEGWFFTLLSSPTFSLLPLPLSPHLPPSFLLMLFFGAVPFWVVASGHFGTVGFLSSLTNLSPVLRFLAFPLAPPASPCRPPLFFQGVLSRVK